MAELSFYENSVRYTQKVEKFTEGKAEIPVEVINVPDNLNLAYFPKSVVVYYQVNLEEFEKVGASDFSVVCDYKSVKDGDDYMIAQIKTKPKFSANMLPFLALKIPIHPITSVVILILVV